MPQIVGVKDQNGSILFLGQERFDFLLAHSIQDG